MNVIIRRNGEGEVVKGGGFKHTIKAKTDNFSVILTELDSGAEN